MHGMCYISLIFLTIIISVKCQEGHFCTTPNGDAATCMSVYDCKHFVKAIRNGILSQLEFIKRSQCGYASTPLVCCGPAVDFTVARAPPLGRTTPPDETTGTFRKSSAIPDRKTCGMQESDKSIDEFVLGGTETHLKEFPWMALLGYTNRFGRLIWSCGGTIISTRYILTAAHCVTGEVVRKVGQLTYVKLGEHNVKTRIDCDKNGDCNDPPVIAGVEKIIFHEKYNPEDRANRNDIALIRLNQRLRYTDFIRPICLPELNETSTPGDYLTTAGWGVIEEHESTDLLLKVELPYRENDECNKVFRSSGVTLIDSQLCVGGEAGKDSCSGDSGGPLMRRSAANQLQWYQEGIVSFGDSRCGIQGLPGIYTKVSNYLPWIHARVVN